MIELKDELIAAPIDEWHVTLDAIGCWVAIEDADTHEVSEFERATEKQVLGLMDGYKADKRDVTKFRVQDVEGGAHVVYDGVTYKGGFGYNLWVAQKLIYI